MGHSQVPDGDTDWYSACQHVKRYLSFTDKVEKSWKTSLKLMLSLVRSDARTVTGHNLRTIMMLSGKNSNEELSTSTVEFSYHKLEESEEWKENMVQELVDIRAGGPWYGV